MAQITEAEAVAELLHMIESTERNVDQLSYKLAKEREEYKKDPADDTRWIIQRTEKRYTAARNRELALRFCLAKLQE